MSYGGFMKEGTSKLDFEEVYEKFSRKQAHVHLGRAQSSQGMGVSQVATARGEQGGSGDD